MRPIYYPIIAFTFLVWMIACRTNRPEPIQGYVPPFTEAPTSASMTDTHPPDVPPSPALQGVAQNTTPAPKQNFLQRIFSPNPNKAPRKVKYKNVQIVANEQTASNGATIGANTQAGPDYSKTKESSTATAQTANTGGNGSKVSGDASSEAKSTIDKGGIKLWMVGLALALGLVGWRIWKAKSVNPVRWFV